MNIESKHSPTNYNNCIFININGNENNPKFPSDKNSSSQNSSNQNNKSSEIKNYFFSFSKIKNNLVYICFYVLLQDKIKLIFKLIFNAIH
jgi:hypothetical protein